MRGEVTGSYEKDGVKQDHPRACGEKHIVKGVELAQ